MKYQGTISCVEIEQFIKRAVMTVKPAGKASSVLRLHADKANELTQWRMTNLPCSCFITANNFNNSKSAMFDH